MLQLLTAALTAHSTAAGLPSIATLVQQLWSAVMGILQQGASASKLSVVRHQLLLSGLAYTCQ